MAVGANTYGAVTGVQARVGDLVPSRAFSGSTTPTTTQVELFLDDVASEMNALMEGAGYTIPLVAGTNPSAYAWAASANEAGASVMVLDTHPDVSYDPDNPSPQASRKSSYAAIYKRFLTAISEGTFKADRDTTKLGRFTVGSYLDDDGKKKVPVFTRAMNDFPGSIERVTDA